MASTGQHDRRGDSSLWNARGNRNRIGKMACPMKTLTLTLASFALLPLALPVILIVALIVLSTLWLLAPALWVVAVVVITVIAGRALSRHYRK